MSEQQRRRKPQSRSKPRRKATPERDFWGSATAIENDKRVDVVRPADDPTAMIRSLGQPPLPGSQVNAEYNFALVYDKAAALAVALAAASGLLDTDDRSE
jgi:hypothetical protein